MQTAVLMVDRWADLKAGHLAVPTADHWAGQTVDRTVDPTVV